MHKSLLALVLLFPAVFSQTTGTATLVGTVTDNTGAVVPGAAINIVNTETQFVYKGQTNAEGAYYVPNLNPGTYRITIEAAGVQTLRARRRHPAHQRTAAHRRATRSRRGHRIDQGRRVRLRCSRRKQHRRARSWKATRSSRSRFCRSTRFAFCCICRRPRTSTDSTWSGSANDRSATRWTASAARSRCGR